MNMMVEDRWQQIDKLLRKKNRTQSEADQLHEQVVEMLTTPEGRESIRKRLALQRGSSGTTV
jgi:Trp operon repressor